MASEDFKRFERDYFTGNQMIRQRQEEDTSVWLRLKGEELEKAKQMILDALPSDLTCYMRAASINKDERAIEKIKFTAEHGKNIYVRATAAKILLDWVGYEGYLNILDEIYAGNSNLAKTSLVTWINGLTEEIALQYFWIAFGDRDSYVRGSAFNALEHYYGIRKIRCDGREIRYYTSDEVYNQPELYEARKKELAEHIKLWKDPAYVKYINNLQPERQGSQEDAAKMDKTKSSMAQIQAGTSIVAGDTSTLTNTPPTYKNDKGKKKHPYATIGFFLAMLNVFLYNKVFTNDGHLSGTIILKTSLSTWQVLMLTGCTVTSLIFTILSLIGKEDSKALQWASLILTIIITILVLN